MASKYAKKVYAFEGKNFFGNKRHPWLTLEQAHQFCALVYSELALPTEGPPSVAWSHPRTRRTLGVYYPRTHTIRFRRNSRFRVRLPLILHELAHALHYSIFDEVLPIEDHDEMYCRIVCELHVRYANAVMPLLQYSAQYEFLFSFWPYEILQWKTPTPKFALLHIKSAKLKEQHAS